MTRRSVKLSIAKLSHLCWLPTVDGEGVYPEGSVHWLVEKRLKHMTDAAKAFGKDEKPKDDKANEYGEKHDTDDKPEPELPS